MDLLFIFLTGLTTGGLSCLAMQGGLLASVIANQKEQEYEAVQNNPKRLKHFSLHSFDQLDWQPVLLFLSTKLLAHVALGFFLGWLGSALTLSLEVRLVFQVFTALFMIATAMNLLNVHPVFRYVSFQPPKFLQRVVRNTTKSRALFAPAVLGVVTIFVPCGVTQAMEVLAVAAGNPVQGALIMGAFVLGTSPLFGVLGLVTAKLSEGWYQRFTKVAAVILLGMAILGINGVLIVINSPITLNKISDTFVYFFSDERFAQSATVELSQGTQEVIISVRNNGYSPNKIRVKAGLPVRLVLRSQDTYSCASSFVMKDFGISTLLGPNDTQTFTFTPTKPGKHTFTCSMGMYTGTLEVI